jgi:hypothetical protein
MWVFMVEKYELVLLFGILSSTSSQKLFQVSFNQNGQSFWMC